MSYLPTIIVDRYRAFFSEDTYPLRRPILWALVNAVAWPLFMVTIHQMQNHKLGLDKKMAKADWIMALAMWGVMNFGFLWPMWLAPKFFPAFFGTYPLMLFVFVFGLLILDGYLLLKLCLRLGICKYVKRKDTQV